MTATELRKKYIEFFKSKGHLYLPSDSLVPDDPTLLFTSAGMVQFKPYFMGTQQPPGPRAVTAQKCLRTDDIEEVGDAVHHTFFEMMGNFSFGDYFKREAILWAWEFLIDWLQLPADRLWTSVYLDDDEAAAIWSNETPLPAERIVRLGEDKNYWPANAPSKGPNGPCGPCNEIFLDMAPGLGDPADPAHAIAYDSNRFVEIWNLVFMQFLRSEGGVLTPLPRQNIDTGLGLERVAAILQGTPTDYETDLFMPLIKKMEGLSGASYGADPKSDAALRIAADHIRGAVFCISDGVMPSNVKRGYVLRRMIRRAALNARLLGVNQLFMADLAPVVADMMSEPYPEIRERLSFITNVLRSEEEKFARTLSGGLSRLKEEIENAKAAGATQLDAGVGFLLYDTYGFPLELTEEMCAAEGLEVNRQGFETLMEEQRRRAREGSDVPTDLFVAGESGLAEIQSLAGATEFLGYEGFEAEAEVQAILRQGELVEEAAAGDEVRIVLDRTPFYAEAGGQVGDRGSLRGSDGRAQISITRKAADIYLHEGKIQNGKLRTGDRVTAVLDEKRRTAIMRNHTATHLLHAALRKTLGTHVAQAGSLVAPERLRFDFSHFQAMTRDEIRQVEDQVNESILAALPVLPEQTTLTEARERGAMALFGEKYAEDVRTISIGDVSLELCGGTHLGRTSDIGLFKIISEGSVAAGVRRIEAVTGKAAVEYVRSVEEQLASVAAALSTTPSDVLPALERLQNTVREQRSALESARSRSSSEEATALLEAAVDVNGFKALCARTSAGDSDAMSSLADQLAEKLGSAVVVLGAEADGKVLFISKVTGDLVGRGLHAGNIIREVAQAAGGGGGGRPEFAKAGGKDPSKLDAALQKAMTLIREAVG